MRNQELKSAMPKGIGCYPNVSAYIHLSIVLEDARVPIFGYIQISKVIGR